MTTPQLFVYLNEFGDALLIRHEVERPTESKLGLLQTLVQGRISYASLDADETGFEGDLWLNDEGLYQPTFTLNYLATVFTGQRIVGPAVIATASTEGDTLGLTRANLRALSSKGLRIDDNFGEGWQAADAVALREGIVAPDLVLPPDARTNVRP